MWVGFPVPHIENWELGTSHALVYFQSNLFLWTDGPPRLLLSLESPQTQTPTTLPLSIGGLTTYT